MSAASWKVPPWTPPTRPRPAATLARNSSRVAPGAAVHVVPTRRSVCASLPPTTTLPRERASAAARLVVRRQHRAVARLDGRRRVDQQLEVALERQLALVEVERVVEREEDAGRAQVGGDLEGVAAQRLQLAMRDLGHPPRAEVDLDAPVGPGRAVDRQPARHLFAQDHVAPVGRPAQQLEPAVDAVVIGDGDQVHAARLGRLVDGQRIGKAVPALEEREIVVVAGMPGMDVEIGPEHGSIVAEPLPARQLSARARPIQGSPRRHSRSKPALSVPLAFATVSSSG